MELTEKDLQEAVAIFKADPATYAAAAEEVFRQNCEKAAKQIVEIGLHGETDKLRLDACKYITDRVLGRIKEKEATSTEKEPWESIFGTVVREPTAEERAHGARPEK